MTLLAVENLSVGYRTRQGLLKAVDGVSFRLDRGKSLGFVGESGCGKTTIGMALLRLLPANAEVLGGRMLFRDRDLMQLSAAEMRQVRWKDIATIFQAAMNALNPVVRVYDQIREAIETHLINLTPADTAARIEKLFAMVGIPRKRMHDFPHQYSGGMKQRAVIAMALACHPAVIIADEPTTALDVIVQDQILKEIKTIQDEFHIGLIFISHDIGVVAAVCHDIAVMYAGQIVETGKREEVFERPLHPYTRLLLSSHLSIDHTPTAVNLDSGATPNLMHPPPGCRFYSRCPLAESACADNAPVWIEGSRTHRALCNKSRSRRT